MKTVKWGIIGPGNIAQNFANGIAQSDNATLVAVSGRNAERRDGFAEKFGIPLDARFDTHQAMLETDLDAVYVATPHPFHANLAIAAMRAGKHVLVEKPAGLVTGEVTALIEVAGQMGVFLGEGLMYRCHPQMAQIVQLIKDGAIGDVQHIDAGFGFAAGFDPASRLFDPALGGGAILDVGLYPISMVRLLAGAALGHKFADPIDLNGTATFAPSGVDDVAHASLVFDNNITATCSTAITRDMRNDVTIHGTRGHIHVPDPWVPGRDAGPSDTQYTVTTQDGTVTHDIKDPRMLFAHEAQAVSAAILAGHVEGPVPWGDSLGNAKAIDAWRIGVGYTLPGETQAGIRLLDGVIPAGLPAMPVARIDGSDRTFSKLVLGCDNRDTLAEGAIIWDAWWEAGGNTFDTAFVYGDGLHEAVLGQWLTARGLNADANVIVKGAHSPYCVPDVIAAQLEISLGRLQLEHAPVYILHRDNLDVPVGDFIDALNGLHSAGKIGAFGASNWTPARLKEANDYAAKNGLRPFTVLNNNLSLAVMERPIWHGCVTSHTAKTLDYLNANGMAHLSWSSQARGYFIAPKDRFAVPAGTEPELFFDSPQNIERRKRATTLADQRGVSANTIALAWVLRQDFPSFAVIGARTTGEIAASLAATGTQLTPDECAWLNLETDALR